MHLLIRCSIGLLFFLVSISLGNANSQSVAWFSQNGDQVQLHVDVFLSSTCPHCHKANEFLQQIEKNEPWLVFNRYVINEDKSALHTFYERLQQQKSLNFFVPALFFCDSQWTGFADANSTGQTLLNAMNYCRQQIKQQGELTKTTINVLRQQGKAYQLQMGVKTKSEPTIVSSALIDALSGCSLFEFMTFLAFIWLYPAQKKLQAAIGVSMLLALAVIHYIQQFHSGFFYQTTTSLRWPSAVFGLLLMLYVGQNMRKIKSMAKVMYTSTACMLAAATAIIVYVYQQTCAATSGLEFAQWLSQQELSKSRQLLNAIAYQLVYSLPLTLFLLFYLLWVKQRLSMRYQGGLTISACLMLVVIASLLIIYPQLLANLLLSYMVIITTAVFAWLWQRHYGR